MPTNTGFREVLTLKQVYADGAGEDCLDAQGNLITKPNAPGLSDYIAPYQDLSGCPVGGIEGDPPPTDPPPTDASKPVASVVTRNQFTSPTDQCGGRYTSVDAFVVLTKADGSPFAVTANLVVNYRNKGSDSSGQFDVVGNVLLSPGDSEKIIEAGAYVSETAYDLSNCQMLYFYHQNFTIEPGEGYTI